MHNKLICLIGLGLGLSSASFAADPGMYLGGQLGMSNTHNVTRIVDTTGDGSALVAASPSNTGMGGRVFAGYNFNQYAAIEGGFTHYAPSTYDVTLASCGKPQVKENAFDLAGKATLPLANLGLFGKAGMAVVNTSTSGSLSSSQTLSTCNGKNDSSRIVRPIIGFGLSYEISSNWTTDVSWSRVMKGNDVQNADLVALGFAYSFGDKRCGEFLC